MALTLQQGINDGLVKSGSIIHFSRDSDFTRYRVESTSPVTLVFMHPKSGSHDEWVESVPKIREDLRTWDIVVIKNKTNIMTKLSAAYKKFLNPALQAQVKAGLRNGNLELTQEGKDTLLEIFAGQPGVDDLLTAAANEKVAEEEKTK